MVAWLAARSPARPDALDAHMMTWVATCPPGALDAAPTMAEAMGVLGVATLAAVTSGGAEGPELALELLAADAFVTYVFEAAAEEGVSVGPLVTHLLSEAA
jgi:hypothetical protein